MLEKQAIISGPYLWRVSHENEKMKRWQGYFKKVDFRIQVSFSSSSKYVLQ